MDASGFDWLKFAFDLLKWVLGGLVFFGSLLWAYHKANEKSRDSSTSELKNEIKGLKDSLGMTRREAERMLKEGLEKARREGREYVEPRLDVQDNKISRIEARLEDGARQMVRIEERINHLPDQTDFNKLQVSMAKIAEGLERTNHTVELVRESLIRERETQGKEIMRQQLKGSSS